MNELEQYFNDNKGRLIHKWNHYFEIYDRHFSKYKNTEVIILEIGVSQGGSLQMWKNYFGHKCKIYGIDINPRCKELEENQVEIIIGNQEDKSFLTSLKEKIPRVDILIDDGGHTMNQQINTFEILFSHVNEDGIYLCEDLHTSYWYEYGGKYKGKNTFIEYSKNFIDYINAWHSKSSKLEVSNFTKSVNSLHYYDSILVIEKRLTAKPLDRTTGKAEFDYFEDYVNYRKPPYIIRLFKKIYNSVRKRVL